MENRKLTKAEVEKISKGIIHSMECEKMTASKQDLKNMNDILEGNKTAEQWRNCVGLLYAEAEG